MMTTAAIALMEAWAAKQESRHQKIKDLEASGILSVPLIDPPGHSSCRLFILPDELVVVAHHSNRSAWSLPWLNAPMAAEDLAAAVDRLATRRQARVGNVLLTLMPFNLIHPHDTVLIHVPTGRVASQRRCTFCRLKVPFEALNAWRWNSAVQEMVAG